MRRMRSGLARAKYLGSARGGTEEFWRQRVTSVLGLPLVIGLLVVFWLLADTDYTSARHLVGHPVVAAVVALGIVNFAVHMRLGAQVIIEDYIHAEGSKIALLMLNTFFCVAVAGLCLFAILKIAFAG